MLPAAWDLTVREIHIVVRAARERARMELYRSMFAAWHNAMWTRAKKMPDWQRVERKIVPPKPQTPQQVRSTVLSIAEALGARRVVRRRSDYPS